MDSSMFDGFGKFLAGLLLVAAISVPFALWKIVELVIYVVSHLRWEG